MKDISTRFSKATVREFMPAVLELQESPPSPLGRIILWTIILFFVSAVIWSFLGKVDIVVVAQGRIIPSGYTKVIQSPEKGTIIKINVEDGSYVEADHIVMELDTTTIDSEIAQTQQDKALAQNTLKRLKYLIDVTSSKNWRNLPDNALLQRLEINQVHAQILLKQLTQYKSSRMTMESTVAKTEALKVVEERKLLRVIAAKKHARKMRREKWKNC